MNQSMRFTFLFLCLVFAIQAFSKSTSNHILIGKKNNSLPCFVTPTADFSASATVACIDDNIIFTDISTDAPTSWNWVFSPNTVTFQNGTNATSQNPEVSFNASGEYNVSLTATNLDGSNSITQKTYILGSSTAPFEEDFSTGVPPSDWFIINPDGLKTWELTTTTGSDGNSTQVARMDNYQYNSPGALDDLVMPSIDLTSMTNPKLYFDVAYAAFGAANSENLHIEYSTDCGATFNATTYDKGYADLPTIGDQSNGWGPSDASHWRADTVDLNAYQSSETILKFVQTNGYGNGLFIDNVRIGTEDPPVANFSYVSDCDNTETTFTDNSMNFPTSWNWTFSPSTVTFLNGTTTNSQHPEVSFDAIGEYTVTLTATNSIGTNSISQTVGAYATASAPYFQDFSTGVPPSDWFIINPDAPAKGWELTTTTGSDGNSTKVARMDNYQYNSPGALDDLVMPSIYLTSMTNPKLYFDVAYAAFNAANSENLHIEYSTDCGVTFNTTSYNKGYADLPTIGDQSDGWGPSDASHWRTDSLDLTALDTGSPMILKFVQTNGYGNGLFINNVRVNDEITLPVELISFDGYSQDCNVILNWVSATEENFDYYEIQRAINPQNFSKITTIKSEGGIIQQDYEYKDSKVNTDHYYRLKMVDIDGSYEYSNTIFVKSKCDENNKGIISLYPNPVKVGGSLQIDFYTEKEEEEIVCINSLGIIVKRIIVNTTTGKNTNTLELGDLPSGNYYIKIGKKGKGKTFVVFE